jgi:hypothetical protein
MRPLLLPCALLLSASLAVPVMAAAPAACSVRSPDTRAMVIELYTSEGCNSCPPADRWAAGLPDTPQRVLLAFHVDYWDRLGWTDRFAAPEFTARQHEQRLSSGARFAYTPQVLLDGRDWRGWPAGSPRAAAAPSPVRITLQLDGLQATARVEASGPAFGALQRYGGYFALVEDGHVSHVRAGENAGATLRHDHVVRQYQPLAAWSAAAPHEARWQLAAAAEPGHPRRVVFVVTDALTQRPLQAAVLDCSRSG